MIISHKHKFIFIATPKCASTTIEAALAPLHQINANQFDDNPDSFYHRQWHIAPKNLKTHFKEMNWNWDKYFKFAFVRNPWDRLVSNFKYQKKLVYSTDKHGKFFRADGEISNLTIQAKQSIYEEFKKNTKENNFKLWLSRDRGVGPCFDFLSDKGGNLMMNFVGKVENLQEDFDTICDKIGIPKQQLPHANKTKHKYYTEYYDDETRAIIAEKYAKDIEHFGYKFGE